MTWDVGWSAGLALKSGYRMFDDWDIQAKAQSDLEVQELVLFVRKALKAWQEIKAADRRPLPPGAAEALKRLEALAAASSEELAALALAQAMQNRIVVRTVDQDGQPITGVRVKLDGGRSLPTIGGTCDFKYVPAGRHAVTTEAKGYAPVSESVSVAEVVTAPIVVTLRLLPVPSVLTVRVRSVKDKPVPGAAVILGSLAPVVARDGSCTFADLMPGVYTVRATAAGFEPGVRAVRIDPRKTSTPDVIIRMGDLPGTLLVTVVDENGKRIPDVSLRLDEAKPRVAAGGSLTFDKLPPGPHRVAAYVEGYGPEAETVIIAPGEQRTLTLRLESLLPPPDEAPPPPPTGGFMTPAQILAYLGPPEDSVPANGFANFQTLWPRREKGPDGWPLPTRGSSGCRVDWELPVPPRENPRTFEEMQARRNEPPPVRCSVMAEVQVCRSAEEAQGILERALDLAAAGPTLEKVLAQAELAKKTVRARQIHDGKVSVKECGHSPGTGFAPEASRVKGNDNLESLTDPFPTIEFQRHGRTHLEVRQTSSAYIYGREIHCNVGHWVETIEIEGREVEKHVYRYSIHSSGRALGPKLVSETEEHFGRTGRFLIRIRLDLKHAFGKKITGGQEIPGSNGRRRRLITRVVRVEASPPAEWSRMRAVMAGLCSR